MSRDLDSFAAEYFRLRLADDASRAERLARLENPSVHEELDDLVDDKPGKAWELILALVERAVTDEDLAFVAAGPIEDLIGRHGGSFCDRIIGEARVNARFQTALNYTWGWNNLPDEVRSRLFPLLDTEVRAYWDANRERRHGKKRWRPPQPRPKKPSESGDIRRR